MYKNHRVPVNHCIREMDWKGVRMNKLMSNSFTSDPERYTLTEFGRAINQTIGAIRLRVRRITHSLPLPPVVTKG